MPFRGSFKKDEEKNEKNYIYKKVHVSGQTAVEYLSSASPLINLGRKKKQFAHWESNP